ncbi:zinc-binding dehydrogenase [Plantactinospora sp. KLBMP9567]|uniref:zinc-binding dehydrogenase n=1 Tax=Plantactinospora sp. KLBMP9567 TaxID=3085900 RepID=UPI0029814DA2|nr:zinc-binding dehydrogenase [Plantactinospora sp. KLBMP9567]MDW5327981.1 zinc-binding dehydrogenase [Plantactinospora sp. KLBMP9567]
MRIAVLTGPERFEIAEVPPPEIGPDEVLVRVRASGVCASELAAWGGDPPVDYPRHLGHEVSGTVAAVGAEVDSFAVGDPVGVWVTSHGFAEYVAAKAAHCRPAGDVPLDEVLAEPLACAVNAVEEADVRLGDDVVLIGAGFMGNLVQSLVRLRGVRQLVVADTRPDALDRARALGATRVVDVRHESLAEVVGELTGGRGADLTFECTGGQAALDAVGEVTRMSGRIVLVGFHQGRPRQINLAHWNWMAFGIVNAHYRDVGTIMRGMTVGMRLLVSGAVSLRTLVTHRFGLEEVDAAFRAARDRPPGFAKATVTFD